MHNKPITKCCDCGLIRAGNDWQPEAPQRSDSLRLYSHTYCPVCLQKAMLELTQIQETMALEMRKAG